MSAAPPCPWRLRRALAGRPTTLTSSRFTGRATPPRAAPSLGCAPGGSAKVRSAISESRTEGRGRPPPVAAVPGIIATPLCARRPARASTHRPLRDAHCAQASPPHAAREGRARELYSSIEWPARVRCWSHRTHPDLPHAALHRVWRPAYCGALPRGGGVMLVSVAGCWAKWLHIATLRARRAERDHAAFERSSSEALCEPEAPPTGCGGSPSLSWVLQVASGRGARFGMSLCAAYIIYVRKQRPPV